MRVLWKNSLVSTFLNKIYGVKLVFKSDGAEVISWLLENKFKVSSSVSSGEIFHLTWNEENPH